MLASSTQKSLTTNIIPRLTLSAALLINWLAVALLFSVPISTTFTSVLVVLYLVLLLASGRIREVAYYIKKPITISIGIFIIITLIGILYTIGPSKDVLKAIKVTVRLMLIPLMMPIFSDEKWRRRGLYALLSAIFLSTVAGYLNSLYLDNHLYASFFKDRIYTSSFTAFGIFCLSVFIFEKKVFSNIFYLVSILSLILLGSYYLFFINSGRTGQLILFALFSLLFYQKSSTKIRKLSLFALTLLISITFFFYFSSSDHLIQKRTEVRVLLTSHGIPLPQLYTRFADGFRESKAYFTSWSANKSKTPPMAEDSSMRLEFYFRTLQIALQRPFIGWGTGSFATVYNSNFPERINIGKKLNNPHNQYLLTYVQLGIPGLLAILLIFICIMREACLLRSSSNSTILIGIVVFMIIGCLLNSWLLDFTSFYFFATIVSLFAIPENNQRKVYGFA